MISKWVLSLAIALEALVRAIEAESGIVMQVQSKREMSVGGELQFSYGNYGKRTLVDICDSAICRDSTLAKPLNLGLATCKKCTTLKFASWMCC